MSSADSSSSGFVLLGVEDVEDCALSNEGEGSLPLDRFGYVSDLVKKGNHAFRQSRLDMFEQAINYYTRANQIKPNDPIILGNRCATYLRISQFLKLRDSSDSEDRPLSGLDPTIHAELALKDAEKLGEIQSNTVRPFILKASALLLLEKYELARSTVISGLQVDPFSNSLQGALQHLEKMQAGNNGRRSHTKPERTDDFDCTLCLKLLYEPITTPCGHSFCRSCLFQSMDRGNKCPLCRTVLFISPRMSAVSVTLNSIIQKNFPEEYAERKAEHDGLTNFGADLMPLFVMDVVIPCQKYHLHIFEPRYRLMVRRIMEGSRRMGMVGIDPTTGSFAEFACEVEITECEPLPDGRFLIEVEGRRRFRIIRSRDQDGYRVAEVEWVRDLQLPDGSQERVDLLESTNNIAKHASSWLTRARQASQQDRSRYEKLLGLERMMPTPRDPERFSFWLATLTNRTPREKLDLLQLTNTRERISRALIYMRSGELGCRLDLNTITNAPPYTI
ncbi:hypothetical protein MLD38_039375 [Melastoma candidum]|uniref:Uncharacterized protein n=1 Tax=Melastoma candidum TaxID=119954 RepID=A0ACB9L2Y3_9MYRT|nr:hypothetical protein MLD38_039375 [Melastoma candidum]